MKIPNIINVQKARGIYLTGSYARGEETKDSDIDILVYTDDMNKTIKKGKYEISYISDDVLDGMNCLIYYPMLKEAKTLTNDSLKLKLIRQLKSKINNKLLRYYVKNTKNMLSLNKKKIQLAKLKNKKINSSVGYSLVLRLRTYYILNCLKNNKNPSTKGLLRLIIQIAGSNSAYKSYKLWKNKKSVDNLSTIEAEKLLQYLNKETKKWQKEVKG